ncbi:MAG: hypothetical protein Kilf2KO_44610 [Rhodospirillales bacterium]
MARQDGRETGAACPEGTSPPDGAPTESTPELRRAARVHTQTALDALVAIARDPKHPASARVAAAREILDRGHGKARQEVTVDGDLRHDHGSQQLSPLADWVGELLDGGGDRAG